MGRVINIILLAPLFLLGGCYDSFTAHPPTWEDVALCNYTIEQQHTLHAQVGSSPILEDLIVGGIVTATDRGGNLYKSFIIESDGYAVEVLEGLYNSYVRHPEGAYVVLRLNGLAMQLKAGVLQVGIPAQAGSSYAVDYLLHESIIDAHVEVYRSDDELSPLRVTISQIEPQYLGRFVEIEGLHLLRESSESSPLWSGALTFEDAAGEHIECYTSPYANFSQARPPYVESVSLRGILMLDADGDYQLRMRDRRDCRVE